MTQLACAIIAIVAWGTWIGISYTARETRANVRTLYVTVGNVIFAGGSLLFQNGPKSIAISWAGFWAPLLGGVVWAAGSLCAFLGTTRVGLARAAGVWTPLNIGMGFVWGVLLFGEFASVTPGKLATLGGSLMLIVLGLLLIIVAKRDAAPFARRRMLGGLLAAILTGVLWGSYFVPAQASHTAASVANFPLAIGMLIGGIVLVLAPRQRPVLPRALDYLILPAAGALWGVGNLAMLYLVELVGTGKGFTIAQLCLLVNALVSIYFFHDPKPRSRAAAITLIGIVVAGSGGVILGNLK